MRVVYCYVRLVNPKTENGTSNDFWGESYVRSVLVKGTHTAPLSKTCTLTLAAVVCKAWEYLILTLK